MSEVEEEDKEAIAIAVVLLVLFAIYAVFWVLLPVLRGFLKFFMQFLLCYFLVTLILRTMNGSTVALGTMGKSFAWITSEISGYLTHLSLVGLKDWLIGNLTDTEL